MLGTLWRLFQHTCLSPATVNTLDARERPPFGMVGRLEPPRAAALGSEMSDRTAAPRRPATERKRLRLGLLPGAGGSLLSLGLEPLNGADVVQLQESKERLPDVIDPQRPLELLGNEGTFFNLQLESGVSELAPLAQWPSEAEAGAEQEPAVPIEYALARGQAFLPEEESSRLALSPPRARGAGRAALELSVPIDVPLGLQGNLSAQAPIVQAFQQQASWFTQVLAADQSGLLSANDVDALQMPLDVQES